MVDQFGYVVYQSDNVGTAMCPLHPGKITLIGDPGSPQVTIVEDIAFGHKFALQNIRCGDPIQKYGARIGTATEDIPKGRHVHLHNIRSDFDARATTLDTKTAQPTDVSYELDGRRK